MFGFVSLRLGPIGLAEALIVLALVLVQVRRMPERSGAYLIGMSLLPLIYLASIVTRIAPCWAKPAPIPCYAPITLIAVVAYSVAGIVGIGLLVLGVRPSPGLSPANGGGRS